MSEAFRERQYRAFLQRALTLPDPVRAVGTIMAVDPDFRDYCERLWREARKHEDDGA